MAPGTPILIAGITLGSLTILMGASGAGIGFSLQNITNNFQRHDHSAGTFDQGTIKRNIITACRAMIVTSCSGQLFHNLLPPIQNVSASLGMEQRCALLFFILFFVLHDKQKFDI